MTPNTNGIAIIGMAGRFPKARDVEEYWKNLCQGVEGISFFSDEELEGIAASKDNSRYVKARGVLEGADAFDAAFFGVNPREAEIMDPQHRLFLECAWEALESAGYSPEKFKGAIGVFGGMSMNTYLANNLRGDEGLMAQVGDYQAMLGNDKDFLTTRVSYKLNLKGPSLNIQTACSTSLVAVCVACQNLLTYECDMAMAGAVSVTFPQKKGYLYQEGGIASPDGHCRAFDAKAAGTVAGEGVGIVVLKRLEEALGDGDLIYAVIKGFAVNNDGSLKVGYTAPSVEGQAEAIATAQAMAGFAPDSISYVEAHGTGTPLGDPIEIEGLTRAFRSGTEAKNFCAIGSVKSNIGHLDTAAGVAGLIKTVLALHHKVLPPSLHFGTPNPKIDFANSPFYVNDKLREWNGDKIPRRAGISSFGIGGTNAHVVLEEATPVRVEGSAKNQGIRLLTVSARTETALEQARNRLSEHFNRNPEINLGDVAYTLQMGRREFTHRWAAVCRDVQEAVKALGSKDNPASRKALAQEHPRIVFMFPGQGSQHVNMGCELYEQERVFREKVDQCSEVLKGPLGFDLRGVLFPKPEEAERVKAQLTQTAVTQPALFVLEYSLAMLWMSWGIRPDAMIGHSIGEYVAACLAGVFSIEDALALVAARGAMMQQLPGGGMLAIRMPEEEVRELLGDNVCLAAVNGAALCVASGDHAAIDLLQEKLSKRGIACTRLHTSHAFHSSMMDPILGRFTGLAGQTRRAAPKIPYISNVTGTWITEAQAADPEYWATHLRQTVRCADGLAELLRDGRHIFLEVGPGQTMTSLARQHPGRKSDIVVVASQGRAQDSGSDCEEILNAAGQLWVGGAQMDWSAFYAGEQRRRVRLPTYPFERKRFWVEPVGTRSNWERSQVREAATNHEPANSVPKEEPREIACVEGRGKKADKEQVVVELKILLGQLSGRDLSGENGRTTFIEMGFDSLFLTQACISIEKKFNVRVAFRELLDRLSTIDLLAAHLNWALATKLESNSGAVETAAGMREQTREGVGSEIPRRSKPSRAEELLERLDQLSDSEVEALLGKADLKEIVS